MKSRRAELALAAVTVIWGATFVLVKSALADVSTFLFLAIRFTLAALVLAAIYRRSLRRHGVASGLFAGSLLFTSYVFQTAGLKLTTPSKSAFLTGLSIPMVPLASSLVYRARLRLFEVAGVVIASVGMALLTMPLDRIAMSPGDFLSFLCAVTFALHIVVVNHYSPIVGFETIAVTQVAGAAAMAIAVALGAAAWSFEPLRFHATPLAGCAIAVTSLFATALAFTTMAWAQQYTSATRSALIFALEPVVAWLVSYAVTGETLPVRGKVGTGLILAGVLLVELRGAARGSGGFVTNEVPGASQ